MCKLTDKWFYDNGYWRLVYDRSASHSYSFPNAEEKWRELSETLLRRTSIVVDGKVLIKIITSEMVCRAIEAGDARRDKRKKKYIKKRDRLIKDDD